MLLYATVRRYGLDSLVFFSPDPRFWAGECVIVCLSFIYYEYAEPDFSSCELLKRSNKLQRTMVILTIYDTSKSRL